MPNSYKYIDFNYLYTDKDTGMLLNLANINDEDSLIFFESTAVSKRTKELKSNTIKIKNISNLFDIHKYLFQDVYEWAGQKRKVEISKGGKQFFPTNRFETAFHYINNLIFEYKEINKKDKPQLARKLADILDSVNFLHPFREGNGRTQREFLRSLALEKGYELNLNPPDNLDIYERYMSGTINGDIEKLSNLILELIEN